jgi:group II intron reverse transcriptase/maturase
MSAERSARSVSATEQVDKVRALQRVLYRSAKQDPHRRFHALFDKVARSDVLWRAWVEVANNHGAPGVDGVTVTSIADGGVVGVRAFLDGLGRQLRDKTYHPRPLRRVHIPKPGQPGATRPLGIPCVADRVVMTAAKLVLEPIFEADFLPVSFGFRPKRSAHQALEAIRVAANRGADWVLDADIKACFDEIDHDALMGQVERRVVDGEMLKLLRSWLRAGVFEGGVVSDADTGTPQGSPISPLLANIVLHALDVAWTTMAGLGTLVRYADDFVVLTTSLPRAEQARGRIEGVLATVGLRLHPDKTRIVCLKDGQDGFDFLGFHHRKTPSKYQGRRYLSKWPSTRAMAVVRAKVRERTDRRFASRDLHDVVADLNPVLRGWGVYFRYGNSSRKFTNIDSYVHWRLSKLASVKYATRGRLRVDRFNYDWLTRLGIYRLTGTVRYWNTAHA